MVAPDVQIEDGKGTILISSEEGETEGKDEREKKRHCMQYFQHVCFKPYNLLCKSCCKVFLILLLSFEY